MVYTSVTNKLSSVANAAVTSYIFVPTVGNKIALNIIHKTEDDT